MIQDAGASKGCVPTLERGYDGSKAKYLQKRFLEL